MTFIEKPSPPGPPEIIEVTEDYVTLHWKEPKSDGKSLITNYIIEYRDKSDKKWHQINKSFTISDTTYKVTTLEKKKEYTFRVIAVNSIGQSEPSEPSAKVKLVKPVEKEAPIIIEPLNDITTGFKQSVILSCVIRGTPKPDITWSKNGKIFTSDHQTFENCVAKYEILETDENSEGEYKVKAKNSLGEAESICHVKIQEIPTLEVDEVVQVQKLKVANQWKVDVKYTGYPRPEITWTKETKELFDDDYYSITTDKTTTTISIQSVVRADSGYYVVTARNEAGGASAQVNLRVFGEYIEVFFFIFKRIFEMSARSFTMT